MACGHPQVFFYALQLNLRYFCFWVNTAFRKTLFLKFSSGRFYENTRLKPASVGV